MREAQTNQRAIESTTVRRSRAAAAEQRLQAVSDAWIAARADVEMGAGSEEYVATLERQRITLETEIRPIREDARVADRVEAKLMQDREALQTQMHELLGKVAPLQLPILQERGEALAAEYTEKLNAFLDVAVRAFGYARAVDETSKAAKKGGFAEAWHLRDLKPILGVHPKFRGFAPVNRDLDGEAAAVAESAQRDLSR